MGILDSIQEIINDIENKRVYDNRPDSLNNMLLDNAVIMLRNAHREITNLSNECIRLDEEVDTLRDDIEALKEQI